MCTYPNSMSPNTLTQGRHGFYMLWATRCPHHPASRPSKKHSFAPTTVHPFARCCRIRRRVIAYFWSTKTDLSLHTPELPAAFRRTRP